MVIRAHVHLSCVHLAFVVALGGGLLACNRPETQSEVTRQGDDVLATGPAPHIVDSVPGDVMFAGRELRFEGMVGGDYLGVGGTQNIGGRVHGALRAAGSQIRLAAAVDRNATVAGWTIEVDRIGVIGRNAYFAGNKVHVDGTVRGGLFVSGGTVVLNGRPSVGTCG